MWRLDAANPNDHIDPADFRPARRLRNTGDRYCFAGNIGQRAVVFAIEMLVLGGVGVEVAPLRVDDDSPQKTSVSELVQRVVDRGQRHIDASGCRFLVEGLRTEVTVPSAEQEADESDSLTCRSQARRLESGCSLNAIQFQPLCRHLFTLHLAPLAPLTPGPHLC